jgi:hypothetical protein
VGISQPTARRYITVFEAVDSKSFAANDLGQIDVMAMFVLAARTPRKRRLTML